jgi:membrane fusion protein, multidrug efflux system
MFRKTLIPAMALIAMAAAGCSREQIAALQKNRPGSPLLNEDARPTLETPAGGPKIRLQKVAFLPVQDEYEAVGTVRSGTTSVLSSKILGSVVSVHVREGDKVRAGQLLLEIDDRDVQSQLQKARAGLREAEDATDEVDRSIAGARASLEAAEANLELATSTFNRYKTLRERHAVSDQEFDEVQARYKAAVAEKNRAAEMVQSFLSRKKQVSARIDQAKADVSNAELHVGFARITAPIAGLVTARPGDVGFLATPGTPLVTIEDDRNYRFEASVEESKARLIRIGAPVRVQIDALEDRKFDGRVAEIVPTADPASHSTIFKIDLLLQPQESGGAASLRSGFFGRAAFAVAQRQAIVVPEAAIVRRGQLVGVFVVDAERMARLRLVKTGKSYEDRVEILSGLGEGETIVVEGAASIADGSTVQE